MRLSKLGEFGLLAELERRGLASGQDAEGAVLAGGLVVTQDTLVEGVHFRREWTGWRDLGWKAAAVNLSDLAACGAEPDALLVALAAPPETELEEVVELYEGLAETGVQVAGGDSVSSGTLALTVTAVGRSERVPGRAGASPGDALVVTGPLGGAAAGLHVLREGLEGFEELVERHRRPPFRLEDGRRLAPVAHALVDLSDGIAGDAARIAERSGCRVVLDVERIPRAPRSEEVADLPFWTMGEDYELLAALAPEDAERLGYPLVGRCEEGRGVEPAGLAAWDAFARQG
ncbi:MAG TPA: thiamine-phosphate kinase [Gaiellaceae bacterium]|nr:thiamine-phosphate kinase [Gaiellaceae bacterium]